MYLLTFSYINNDVETDELYLGNIGHLSDYIIEYKLHTCALVFSEAAVNFHDTSVALVC